MAINQVEAIKVESDQPYNFALAARDEANGYPAKPTYDTTNKELVNRYIKPETGSFKTQWIVDQEDAAAAKKAYDASTEVKTWSLKPNPEWDWSGTKYVSQMFGDPILL